MSSKNHIRFLLMGMVAIGIGFWLLGPRPAREKTESSGTPQLTAMPMGAVGRSNSPVGIMSVLKQGPPAPPVNRVSVPAVPFTRRFWVVDDGSVAERAKMKAEAQMYHLIYRPMPPID
jgi:hypothetical protein